jgi:hypothetical protein
MKKFITYYKQLSKFKNLEFEFYKNRISFYEYGKIIFKLFSDDSTIFYFKLNILNEIFDIDIMLNKKTDHAGFKFNLSLFGFNVSFIIYDCRHWDVENNTWCKY